jgi:hypothetical protein
MLRAMKALGIALSLGNAKCVKRTPKAKRTKMDRFPPTVERGNYAKGR